MTARLKHPWRKILSVAQWPLKTSWQVLNWFYKDGLTRVLLGIVLLLEIRRDFIEGRWLPFDVPRRFFSWLLGGAVVQSILGALSLLAGYGLVYYWISIRKRRFIVVSEFRVWGELATKCPEKGVAALLRDELMSLWNEMRAPDSAQDSSDTTSSDRPRLPDDGGISLPETHVTLQYEGISLEGMHTFIRRTSGREMVITGDLVGNPSEPMLVARTANEGSWKAQVKNSDLGDGLQRLALQIMTTMTQRFQLESARTFALLQIKASELREYDLALRLAKLGWLAAPDTDITKGNLAIAHHDRGVELFINEKYEEAAQHFEEAVKLKPDFVEAYDHLGLALASNRKFEKAIRYFNKAIDLKPDFVEAYDHLGLTYQSAGEQQNANDALRKAEEIRQRLQS